MMLFRIAALVLALAALGDPALAGPARADPGLADPVPPGRPSGPALGSYEASALARALAARGLTIEPSPAGKRVGRIIVVNLDVFGEDEGFLGWANFFHITTKEFVIAREVLLRPGDRWDDEIVDESRRRLRDPLFTTLVVIAPVVAEAPDAVDLLVVTRDIWSLRMNSRFEAQEGVLTDLSLSLSENNLFGLRKQVAFVFDMDLGAYSLGPQYVDKNMGGTRLQLLGKLGAIFSRDGNEFEGTRSFTSLSYPLWSLDRDWGASIVESHFDATVREFFGPDLFLYDNPDTEDVVEEVPVEYGLRTVGIETSVVRQFGHVVKQRVTFGHELDVVRPRLFADFPGDEATRDAFTRDLLPRSERSSALFIRHSLFTPQYVVYRNLDSYDLAEDIRLGPELGTEIGFARKEIGSESNFVSGSIGGAWTVDLIGDGFARTSFGVAGRLERDDLIDRFASATLSAASPAFRGVRLVGRANVSAKLGSVNNQPFKVGGLTGLRGYPIDFFRGERQILTNLEARTRPFRLLFTRAGLVAFWDMGHAADYFPRIDLHHDFGVGARLLIPQLQPYVFRLDCAWASAGPTAGPIPRVTLGVLQVF